MNKNKQLAINMFAAFFASAVSMGISFILTTFIVKRLGNEAYGFVGLTNNFVSYASLLTVALNSMASRFVTIELHKGNIKKANIYFNSVLIADAIISAFLAVLVSALLFNLKSFINVSDYLYRDVQITFALTFLNFILTVMSTVFSIATFAKNRLELSSIRTIVSNIIKVLVIVPLFVFLPAKIYYIGIAAVICTAYLGISNYSLTKRLLPEIKINFKCFELRSVLEIIASGIWNSFNKLSAILLSGLDLWITNYFIDADTMGVLSIAITIPNAISTFVGTLSNAFAPYFTMLYAKNKINELVAETKFSIKIMTFIMAVPMAGFIAFGMSFYSLWMPYKSPSEILTIQILSVLTLAPYVFSVYVDTLYVINTVTNKLKIPVTVSFSISLLSVLITFILLKTTSLGVYAVAGVSSLLLILRILIFVPTYAAFNLKVRLTTFYPTFIRAMVCFFIILGLFFIVNRFVSIHNWLEFIALALISGVFGYVFNTFILLNKSERQKAKGFILRRLHRS